MAERLGPRDLALQEGSGLVCRDGQPVTDWTKIRRWVLDRDGNTCQLCMASPATDVDHVWPRRLGGRDHVDNLRAACGPCNKAKGSRVLLAVASRSELHAAADALTGRLEALLAEFEPVVNAIALRHPDDAPWVLLRLGPVEFFMKAIKLAIRNQAHRQSLVDGLPDAVIVQHPRSVALDADTRIAEGAMQLAHWTQRLNYLAQVNQECFARENQRFAALAPYLHGDTTTEQAVKAWQDEHPTELLP